MVELVLCQAVFHELQAVSKIIKSGRWIETNYLFLLHEFGWGAVIANILPEYWDRKITVDIGCTEVTQSAIQHKVIALGSQAYGVLSAYKHKREYISIL